MTETPTVDTLLGAGFVLDKGRPAKAPCGICAHRWGAHRASLEWRSGIEPGEVFEAFGRVFCHVAGCRCDNPWTVRADIAP